MEFLDDHFNLSHQAVVYSCETLSGWNIAIHYLAQNQKQTAQIRSFLLAINSVSIRLGYSVHII